MENSVETQCKFHLRSHPRPNTPGNERGLLVCTIVSKLVPAAPSLLNCSLQLWLQRQLPWFRKPPGTLPGSFPGISYCRRIHLSDTVRHLICLCMKESCWGVNSAGENSVLQAENCTWVCLRLNVAENRRQQLTLGQLCLTGFGSG